MPGTNKKFNFAAIVIMTIFSITPAFSQTTRVSENDLTFHPLNADRFFQAVETLIRETEPDFGRNGDRYSAADIEILKRLSRRLGDDRQYRSMVNARLKQMFDLYVQELPPAVQQLPYKNRSLTMTTSTGIWSSSQTCRPVNQTGLKN